jgi:protein gp37
VNKSKIEWCDYTWNPVTGCFHICEYCYARRQSKRFAGQLYPNKVYATEKCKLKLYKSTGFGLYENYSIDKPVKNEEGRIIPYPFGFKPTFYRYRLDEPQKLKKPSKIFVSSMGDLFGEWVPDTWIEEVFKECEVAQQHTYMFLTKNPEKMATALADYTHDSVKNWWFGASITKQEDIQRIPDLPLIQNRFISVEPLLGEIDFAKRYPQTRVPFAEWVIIGRQTGPGAKPPKDEWVQSIIDQCRAAEVPVFVKSPLYEKFSIQEYPKEMGVQNNE